MKEKQCKICGSKYEPRNGFQKVCRPQCAIEHVRRVNSERDRKQRAKDRKRSRTRQEHLKLAQTAFNAFIRLRDAAEPCVSCGSTGSRTGAGAESFWHAGHFRSIGACPELRFDERNCHKQCVRCNTHFSGNQVEYRKGLIDRIGVEAVELVEGPHEPKKYTIDDLKEITRMYRAKGKDLRAKQEVPQ